MPSKKIPINNELNKRLGTTKKTLQGQALNQALEIITGDQGGKSRQVHLTDITAECVRMFRGPQGLARRLYQQYLKAPDGSQTRTKILDTVFKLIINDTAKNGSVNQTDVGDMTDDEMHTEVEDLINGVNFQDLGDPSSPDDQDTISEAIDEAELADPEIAEIDADIARMEAQEEAELADPAVRLRRMADQLDGETDGD